MIARHYEVRGLVAQDTQKSFFLSTRRFRITGEAMGCPRHNQGKVLHPTSTYRQPMIRFRARCARRALDDVQPVHIAVRIATAGEITDVLHVAGESSIEE